VIRIGTRGSALALNQANWIIEQLQNHHPNEDIELRIIRTTGDEGRIETKGAFIKEIELALLEREIDLGVHSLKDMPTELAPGLKLVAFPQRVNPCDALICAVHSGLADLPTGARIGTGSPRRSSQLLAYRPDLKIVDMKGNVDTRLRKLVAGQCDAMVLAMAGLERLNLLHHVTEVIAPEVMLPAVGQGALGLEARTEDGQMRALLGCLDDVAVRAAVVAERAFLHRLGGGCRVPIAAHGKLGGDLMLLNGLVARPDGSEVLRDQLSGAPREAEALGRELGDRLLAAGAASLLKGAL